MVDPNRKINRLTDKDIDFLADCEEEFGDRFTEHDKDFMDHCKKGFPTPPVVDPWQTGSGDGGRDNGRNQRPRPYDQRNRRGGGGHRNNYRGGGGYNRHDHGHGGHRQHHNKPYQQQEQRNSYY